MHDATTPGLTIDIELHGDVAVVNAHGEVDLATSSALADGMEQALAKMPTAIVVDLSGVTFLASVGMSVLITAQRKIGTAAALLIVADGPSTRRPMELVGLDATLSLHTDLTSALAALATVDEDADVVVLPSSPAADTPEERVNESEGSEEIA